MPEKIPARGAWSVGHNHRLMKKNKSKIISNTYSSHRFMSWLKPALYTILFVMTIGIAGISFFVVKSVHFMAHTSISDTQTASQSGTTDTQGVLAEGDATTLLFPIGVNPMEKEITESPEFNAFVDTYIETDSEALSMQSGWFGRVLGKLALMNWYQNLASLSSRMLVVQPGERKEQITDHFGKILKWDASEKKEFLALIQNTAPELKEGKLFPGTYTVSRGASPSDVASLLLKKFDVEVVSRYSPEVERIVPLNDALTIASLLEREARDFEDMRHISGVIWNRLFVDMKLQIDATLQYAKGSKPSQPWWPRVVPSDKYLASAYNTYENEGLPPAPIANPSLESIIAALNPTKTDCMFYFHDKRGEFHCTKTYEEHVALLKQYYGRGK